MADSAGTVAGPISPRGAAYLDALKRGDIPIADIPTLLLVADSVCARQGDTNVPAQVDRVMAAFPGRWSHQQTAMIVDSAIKLVCADTARHGANVSAGVYPGK